MSVVLVGFLVLVDFFFVLVFVGELEGGVFFVGDVCLVFGLVIFVFMFWIGFGLGVFVVVLLFLVFDGVVEIMSL